MRASGTATTMTTRRARSAEVRVPGVAAPPPPHCGCHCLDDGPPSTSAAFWVPCQHATPLPRWRLGARLVRATLGEATFEILNVQQRNGGEDFAFAVLTEGYYL